MTKDISISLINLQTDETGEEHITELETTGLFFEKNGNLYIMYDEVDPDDGAVTGNTLKIHGSTVEINRKGAVKSHMLFESGSATDTSYITSFGILHFQLQTHEVTVILGESVGEIRLVYDLFQDDILLFQCSMSIKIKAQKKLLQ